VALLAATTFGGGARAASPQLSIILPPGVERGKEQVLTFTGARLEDVADVLFYGTGVTLAKVEPVDAQNVRVTVSVAADCPVGQHLAQVRTRSGLSEYRSFFVGVLPAIDEKEPNSLFEAPQAIEPNVCVAGTLQNEDVDHFRIRAKKGERLSVEVEGIRLGQAYFDPYLAILDQGRFEIAASDDTVLLKQDCFLSTVIPEDGEYTILLRETSYRGSDACRYRLHIGNFPRPTVAYPAGGKVGEKVNVELLGDGGGPMEREIVVPDASAGGRLTIEDERGVAPSTIPFHSFPHGNILEAEPNNEHTTATQAELPLALNGRLAEAGDVDYFKIAGKKGEVWEIECYARRIGSPIDPVIHVFNSSMQALGGDDDARVPDSYLRWQVPDDGDYFFRVMDHLNQGGETYVYRVEFKPVTPSLSITIPRVDRYSQTRQTVVVPRGNRYGTLILANRADFGGPVAIVPQALLPGMTMASKPMHPSMTLMPVVFEAAADAPLGGQLVDFRAKLAAADQPAVEGGFTNTADFVLGEPNAAVYDVGIVDRLAMAVVEKVPFRLELVEPKVPLVRNGTMNLKVIVHRDEGFKGAVRLEFPFCPAGVGTTGAVSVAEGQSEGLYPLNANTQALLGEWPIFVFGAAELGGEARISSELKKLTIAEAFVTASMKRAACEQGQEAQIACALTHNSPFEGSARAELLGLPPGVTVEPVEFTAGTSEIVFRAKTTDQTPAGNHTTLFCQITITQHGEPIVATAGTAELQVSAPLPKNPTVAAAPAPAAAAPAKPLSRLEQLRAQALQARSEQP
jgi:hypothetical protein